MKIDHIALWVEDLEQMRDFYVRYFDARPGPLYHNPAKQFHSCFLEFKDDCRLEIMSSPFVKIRQTQTDEPTAGLTHIAFSAGSKERVNQLTEQLRCDGFAILGEPRTTGDGYYESIASDPEGNRIEITT